MQLIGGISNDLKKIDKYLNGAAIFTLLNTLLAPIGVASSKSLDLYLNDVELAVVILGFITRIHNSYILNCHKVPDMSK